MSVQVYGINHLAIEVDDVAKAVEFYEDVFHLEKMDEGEGDAFFKIGQHQFLAIFKVDRIQPDRTKHFGLIVRDEAQLEEVREKLTQKYKLKLIPGFRCDFSRSFWQPHPSRRSARRVVGLAFTLPGSAKSRHQVRVAQQVAGIGRSC